MLTVNGPTTYYDYHSHGMGLQYLLCEKFAQQIGVSLRVEECKDTAEMVRKFMKKNNINADIHVITGSVEISPGIGLADGIFDIVSSGSTLVSNNLAEVEVVMKSEALLIGNWIMDEEKHQILNEMLFRFEAVRSAQDKKYVMMNAPKAKVQEITEVLPGIKSPTIIPLADEEWCSIHTVLDEKRFWEIIGKLKELGAQGILVTPIEKMIL